MKPRLLALVKITVFDGAANRRGKCRPACARDLLKPPVRLPVVNGLLGDFFGGVASGPRYCQTDNQRAERLIRDSC